MSLLTRWRRPSDQPAPPDQPAGPAQPEPAQPEPAQLEPAQPSSEGERWHHRGRDLVRRWARPVAAGIATGLAGLLVLVALVIPNDPTLLTLTGFLRIPAEVAVGIAVVLVLPARPRRLVAAGIGALLGLVAIGKVVDIGFFTYLLRPFNPVFDWTFFRPAYEFLADSMGQASANWAAITAVTLALAVLIFMILSAMRLASVLARHRTRAAKAAAGLGVGWLVCALLAVQIVPDLPVATAPTFDRFSQVFISLHDRSEFAADLAADDFQDLPADQLLTALRGKDVVIAYVESYGRDAATEPEFAPIGTVLADSDRRLRAAGFGFRSGFLTSPTAGGGSWLAHASLLTGLWVDNQERYRTLVESDRLTLNRAFQQAGWRTAAVMPGIIREWPEGAFFGYDQIYANADLGYQGPRMNWATIPDQYTLAAMQRFERDRPDRAPVMVEMPLASSHAPWLPLAQLIGWDEVGDGSVYESMPGAGVSPDPLWRSPDRARPNYARAISYTLESLFSYVETYGDEDLVMIILGDHQPAALITGEGATRDVPITMVTADPSVLARISDWGWHTGLAPDPDAPLWGMDEFRDRFLAAYSPESSGGAGPEN